MNLLAPRWCCRSGRKSARRSCAGRARGLEFELITFLGPSDKTNWRGKRSASSPASTLYCARVIARRKPPLRNMIFAVGPLVSARRFSMRGGVFCNFEALAGASARQRLIRRIRRQIRSDDFQVVRAVRAWWCCPRNKSAARVYLSAAARLFAFAAIVNRKNQIVVIVVVRAPEAHFGSLFLRSPVAARPASAIWTKHPHRAMSGNALASAGRCGVFSCTDAGVAGPPGEAENPWTRTPGS